MEHFDDSQDDAAVMLSDEPSLEEVPSEARLAFDAALSAGEALPYPRSAAEFQELVDVARSRQRSTLRLLVAASGLTITEISRRVVAAAPSLPAPLRLGNLLSGNTMANAERAEALAAFFGRSVQAIAPHLSVMPWFSHPGSSRWMRSYAGLEWGEVERRRRNERDVRRLVEDVSASFVEVATGRPPLPSETMTSVSMLAGSARFFLRGFVTPERSEALQTFLTDHSSDPSDVIETDSTVGGRRVAFVCDVLLPPSRAARALGLVGGPLPRPKGLFG